MFLGVRKPRETDDVRDKQFSSTDNLRVALASAFVDPPDGYDKKRVDAFLDAAGIGMAAMESTDRPRGPLVSGAILAERAEWADLTRFSTTPRLPGATRRRRWTPSGKSCVTRFWG
jgi:hypothetical protein